MPNRKTPIKRSDIYFLGDQKSAPQRPIIHQKPVQNKHKLGSVNLSQIVSQRARLINGMNNMAIKSCKKGKIHNNHNNVSNISNANSIVRNTSP